MFMVLKRQTYLPPFVQSFPAPLLKTLFSTKMKFDEPSPVAIVQD
jgi:hypothetical protein